NVYDWLHPMEVKVINKQKFLAELGRLLTFMYEEDRQTALAMYSKMFDDAAEEQLLLQFLVSPTRQAVVLARAYDAKERKLQVHTQSREQDGGYAYSEVPEGELPPFILAIDDLQREAAAQGIFEPTATAPAVDENQFSLFDEVAQAAPAEAPGAAAAELTAEAAPGEAEDGPVNDSVSEFADAVDAFLADFAIAGGELVSKKDGDVPAAEEAEAAPADGETPFEAEAQPEEAARGENDSFDPAAESTTTLPEVEEEAVPATRRKAKVFLLILYILFAVPLGLLGVAALLVPTLLSLLLAIGFVSGGVLVLTAAFGGFAIFADLMVILGLAIILLALGLLLTWLFIWFIGGAIAGLIRGLCHLGGKWCFKEVPVQ
ncbi:MAG: hypothetical protein PUC45_03780, partial [Oscillospiraceae bacterium]|nr:hypothetical protein [Oscillospiraceae bacterium]